jgi:hypothetical protein
MGSLGGKLAEIRFSNGAILEKLPSLNFEQLVDE